MKNQDREHLERLRHSCAHLLAAAVKELYPQAKLAIGPAIENGFYYDIDFPQPVSEEDLPKIEKRMAEILPTWTKVEGEEISVEEAKKRFSDSPYKLEIIDDLASQGETLRVYRSGDFEDLCKGGHTENPSKDICAFKLLSLAGAYWRGSEKNPMLTRMYGTCFPTLKELDEYLQILEEAKKRDHRKLGHGLEIFTTSEEIGPGLILWLPKGTIIKDELERLAKEIEAKNGYQRVSTPHITKESLYQLSGHLPYYADDMYPPMEAEEGNYYLKPMNCPHVHMIYKFKERTYKELPLRYAEYGTVYRYEKSGELFGLLRVRGMTQNDAHIYCSESQVVDELVKVMRLHAFYYDLFGIKDYYIELALPDFKRKKDKYFDDPESWDKSINYLREAANKLGVEVSENEGGAAFYGPKFDFNIKSAIGREFGASTNQLDFGSGKRFNLAYIDKDGSKRIVPYIIHRAPLGSHERFVGFLIEHYGGAFPTWLSPIQVIIIPISEKHLEYGQKVLEQLKSSGIRVELDDRSETMQAKIRDAQLQKIPYMLIVGDREEKENTVSVRNRKGENLGTMPQDRFLEKIKSEIALRQ